MKVVIVNCFDPYEQRVDLVYQFFRDKGNEVRVLSSDFRHIEKTKRTEPKEGYTFFAAEPYHKNLSIQRMKSHIHLSRDIFAYVESQAESIDLLWVLVPPNTFVKDAAKIKRNHPNIKLVFDVIDMWPETLPVGKIKNYYPIKAWGTIRNNRINIADAVVTECSLYQDKLQKYVPCEKMKTLYLARKEKEFCSVPNLPENTISLCYLGSINNIIDIDEIGRIIQSFKKKSPVVLHVIGTGEKKQDLINMARSSGADVVDHGKVYDSKEKQQIFDSCHFGLNVYKPSVYIGLTMKSIDYFEAGLPIINTINGDTWEFIEKFQAGINIHTPQSNNINSSEYELNISYEEEMRSCSRELFDKMFSISAFENRLKDICALLNLRED